MTSPNTPTALWRQLNATAAVVEAVSAGTSGTAALEAVPANLRPGVQALTFEVLRSWGRARALRKALVARTPPAAVDALLCTALALLWQQADALYDDFTLVNQAVEAAKKHPATRPQAAFINACLRRFLRERAAFLEQTGRDLVAIWNHPDWWIAQLQLAWPQHWQAILAANNRHAPMVLRVNVRKTSVAAYSEILRAAGLASAPVGNAGLVLAQACAVQQLPGFAQGLVSVQDAAAQLAAPLLLAGLTGHGPLRVLDACAAPGGKTAHLLELADVEVTALDVDGDRCERIHQTMRRLGLNANIVQADACDLAAWWTGELFDGILLDAPCSASGVVRRHPDIRWLRRPTDIAKLASLQARLLTALWPLLKPGGCLLYCTCSVFPAEGEQQINAFLANTPEACRLPAPGHLLPSVAANAPPTLTPLAPEQDGFYYALLQKTALS